MIPFLVAAAAPFFAADVPVAARQAKLAAYFTPNPTGELVLEPSELQRKIAKKKPTELRGHLEVHPPNGTCFTITRSEDDADEVYCKRTTVQFTLGELDRDGRLVWRIRTGENDIDGTQIAWRTPYRLAIVTPFDKTMDDPPKYEFITKCVASDAPTTGRRMTLSLLSGKTWIVTMPDKDKMVPQPDPVPNLVIISMGGKVSVTEAAETEKAKKQGGQRKAQAAAKAAEKAAEGGEHGEAPAAEHGDGEHGDKAPPPDQEKKIYDSEDRAEWSIPRRNAYEMNGSHFQPLGSAAPKMKSLCRYLFSGSEEDPKTGRLECHDVDGYKSVYLPLTCLRDLGPRG